MWLLLLWLLGPVQSRPENPNIHCCRDDTFIIQNALFGAAEITKNADT